MRFALSSRRCSIPAFCLLLGCAPPLHGQKNKREPLNEAQIEQIREAGKTPAERIKLYAKFAAERTVRIKSLSGRPKSAARNIKLDDELQELTALFDELGSNLDQYADRRADLRSALKPLADESLLWLNLLRALAGEPGFDLARKEAIESCYDLSDQAKRLLSEQTEYFILHKEEAGQERYEPKP